MDQIKYQGYAQGRGFNPVQISTASVDALGQQGNAVLRQLQQNQSIARQNRDAYLSQVKQNQAIEAQNREDNFRLKQASDALTMDAYGQRSRVGIANAQRQADDAEKTFAALASFSGTIGKMLVESKQRRDQEAELEGQNLIVESGITPEEFLQLKAGEAQLNAADSQVNAIINKLQAAGYGEEYISRLRKLSGRQLYGAHKQWAIQGGENYAAFRAQMVDVPFDIGGQQITLGEASKASPEVYEQVSTLIRKEYLKQYQGLNKAFANEYLYDGIRKTEARERLLYSEERSKELELDRINSEQNDLFTEWQSAGGEGVLQWINIKAGGDRRELGDKRRTALGYLTNLAKSGRFTSQDLMDLESTQFIPNGESKPVLFGERFGPDLVELRSAVRTFNNQQRQDREIALEDEQAQFEQRITQYISQNGPLTKAEIQEAEKEWMARGFGSAPGWLKSLTSAEQISDELGKTELEQRKAYGMLSLKYLYSGRFSPELINQYKSAAQQQESVDRETKSSSYGAVDAALKETLDTVKLGSNQNSDFFIAQGEARRILSQEASILIGQGVAPIEAWKQATKQLREEILRGKTGQGRFSLRMQANGQPDLKKPGFQLASNGTNATSERQRAVRIQNLITTQNPKALFQQRLLTEKEVEQLEGFRDGSGSIPPVLWAIASRVRNADVFDIADAQLKAYGRPPLLRPPTTRLVDEVSPQFRQLLTWRPSIDRTLRAVEGGYGGASGNPYAPVLDLIASKESTSTDPTFNGYDAMNKGGRNGGHTAIGSGTGSANFGRPLTQMTVGQVLALGRDGQIHAAGRYQFINTTLQGLVDRGRAKTGELFNEEVQDRLAVALLREQTGQFWSGRASAASYVPGLGQTWIGLQKLRPGQLVRAMEQAKANLSSTPIDASRLKPQVAYRVSGIGPTSTGPHLDVKDVTGAYFGRNALDKYISFKLPQGLVPLSSGVTVAGGRFGAPRSYGSHNGWDYAVPDGTPVVLKNGARVISKRPSEHGDVLTIALPDGRRFTFLHGKAV